MLDATLSQQLRQHLTSLRHPIELVATLDDSGQVDRTRRPARRDRGPVRPRDRPSRRHRRPGPVVQHRPRRHAGAASRFAGIPLGHEFTSLVLALLHVGGHPPRVSDEVAEQIRAIPGTHHFETFFSLTCQNCPDVVQALNVISVLNPNITHVAIDGARVQGRGRAAPGAGGAGRVPRRRDVRQRPHDRRTDRRDARRGRRDARRRRHRRTRTRSTCSSSVAARPAQHRRSTPSARACAPASSPTASADRCSTRWASRTSSRCAHTEGPKLAAALEEHVREHDVDVMNLQRATKLVPADEPGGLITVELESGAPLRGAHGRAGDRRPLAAHERAGRDRLPQPGRGVLPALRRPAVRRQAHRGDRRRQLRRRSGDRSRRHRRARHAHRVRHAAARRRRPATQAAQPAQRRRRRRRPHDRGARRRRAGHRARATATAPPTPDHEVDARRHLRPDRAAPEHRLARRAASSCPIVARSSSTIAAGPPCPACSRPATARPCRSSRS